MTDTEMMIIVLILLAILNILLLWWVNKGWATKKKPTGGWND